MFGSLLIAAHDTDNRLILLGGVGTGFTNTARRALHRELIGLSTPAPPVAGSVPASLAGAARWVSPRLVGEVTYRERTASSLRHPSWRGLRPDREIYEVKLPVDS
ncbi:hypothetical protein [Nocardia cyriacigeorgica]|uniref:ATP dependent DNA ligase n=1 Tax=Nocardia cyriacigeorgica TaxID=135487 RepID=UPI00201747EF|nr:hypothetical protein [Nocardia cyriacigeorgica]